MELMCDVRKDGTDPDDILRNRCHSNSGDNVPTHAGNTLADVAHNARQLERTALRRGWKKTKGQWACPGCKE